jgi:hypothetical protein
MMNTVKTCQTFPEFPAFPVSLCMVAAVKAVGPGKRGAQCAKAKTEADAEKGGVARRQTGVAEHARAEGRDNTVMYDKLIHALF